MLLDQAHMVLRGMVSLVWGVDENCRLGAQIIAAADFFEAVTAERHYHEPMPPEQALSLLKGKTASHFDPSVVDAFIRYYKSNPAPVALKKVVSY